MRSFNPRPRVGGDERFEVQFVWYAAVSIHAPAWGATRAALEESMAGVVSIHAPAWGATCHAAALRRGTPVSIHAPAWGATGGLGFGRL